MGIFGRNQDQTRGHRAATELFTPPAKRPLAVSSPWAPTSAFVSWAVDEALGGLTDRPEVLTRESALKVPGIKRAHGIICTELASTPFYEMNDDERTDDQPSWLTNSASGVSPYHRMFGAASDWFFYAWAAFGFTEDWSDCLHIPFGYWEVAPTGIVVVTSDEVPDEYTAHIIAVPLGFGENGVLVDGSDTIHQAKKIEKAYADRLDNPIPLTDLEFDAADWDGWSPEERREVVKQWNEQRRINSTSAHSSKVKVTVPGATAGEDLYQSGRNAVRLDIANHVALPASIIEGVRQGGSGGGTEMRYQGVNGGGASRSEMWDYGLARRMVLAFEARMSLDDVCRPGLSIRGDLSDKFAVPNPDTNPTSKD